MTGTDLVLLLDINGIRRLATSKGPMMIRGTVSHTRAARGPPLPLTLTSLSGLSGRVLLEVF